MGKPGNLKYHNKRVCITKIFTFDSAHYLYDYVGPCAELHGHTYKLEVTYSGYTGTNGMVIDFKELKSLVQKHVLDILDHKNLNDVLPDFNPTAENIVYWIWERLSQYVSGITDVEDGFRLEKIKLYETPTSFVEMLRE